MRLRKGDLLLGEGPRAQTLIMVGTVQGSGFGRGNLHHPRICLQGCHWFRVQGSGSKVQDSGFRVQGLLTLYAGPSKARAACLPFCASNSLNLASLREAIESLILVGAIFFRSEADLVPQIPASSAASACAGRGCHGRE